MQGIVIKSVEISHTFLHSSVIQTITKICLLKDIEIQREDGKDKNKCWLKLKVIFFI